MKGFAAGFVHRVTRVANRPRRDAGVTRAVYSYPAKFQAHLPAELIRLCTRPGELVLDPYVGSGTTGLEAWLEGRRFFGVDLSPFALLLARVKTTPVDAAVARGAAASAETWPGHREVLDEDDARCLGPAIASEVCRLAAATDPLPPAVGDLLRVALIHAVKMAGRRDFDAPSIVPLFRRRVERALAGLAALPRAGEPPRFRRGSADAMPEIPDGAARLVVTSPPYKDLDVEYGLLQIQRPGRSKRSRMIWQLLDEPALPKSALCGGRGGAYWERLRPALREIRRVLAPGAPAFFWTGFKTPADRDGFVAELAAAGLPAANLVAAALSDDRVASSRSTHHGRATGMLARDYLIMCQGLA
jgi:hypothetical protein